MVDSYFVCSFFFSSSVCTVNFVYCLWLRCIVYDLSCVFVLDKGIDYFRIVCGIGSVRGNPLLKEGACSVPRI